MSAHPIQPPGGWIKDNSSITDQNSTGSGSQEKPSQIQLGYKSVNEILANIPALKLKVIIIIYRGFA